MSNGCNKRKTNLLKGIGVFCVFAVFGYYSYQDAVNRNMLEKSLNEITYPPEIYDALADDEEEEL